MLSRLREVESVSATRLDEEGEGLPFDIDMVTEGDGLGRLVSHSHDERSKTNSAGKGGLTDDPCPVG